MNCAPFLDPLDNALSYLYTNKAIDEDLNITSPRIDFYLDILQKQAGEPLFTKEKGKLVPIGEAFDRIGREEEGEEVEYDDGTEGPSYSDLVAQKRQENKANWQNSGLTLPSTLDEREYLEDLLNQGAFEIRCS